jgi:undecaprenyl-diphosphatase
LLVYDCAVGWLIGLDRSLFVWINTAWSNPGLDGFFLEVTALGAWPIVIVALAFLSAFPRTQFLRHLAVLVVFWVAGSACNTVIKHAVDRDRPLTVFAESGGEINALEHYQPKHFSFPSGHSFTAFFCMAYVGFARRKIMPYAFALAVLVALSRVYVGAHFPLDCVGSAVLGISWAWLAWRAYGAWQARIGGSPAGEETVAS